MGRSLALVTKTWSLKQAILYLTVNGRKKRNVQSQNNVQIANSLLEYKDRSDSCVEKEWIVSNDDGNTQEMPNAKLTTSLSNCSISGCTYSKLCSNCNSSYFKCADIIHSDKYTVTWRHVYWNGKLVTYSKSHVFIKYTLACQWSKNHFRVKDACRCPNEGRVPNVKSQCRSFTKQQK